MPQTETEIISAHPVPVTQAMIEQGLRAAGLRAGAIVLAHARLSAFGWIPGAAETVVHAVLSVLGPRGTLIVPAFSGHLSDPSHWRNPPVPESWWPIIRAQMPAFDPVRTPTRGIGALPAMVCAWPGYVRSAHPQGSFAAIGPHAERLTAGHRLEAEFGPDSPLDRLVGLGGQVLFLGSGWDTATIFHLGEHKAGVWGLRSDGAPIMVDGQRRWVEFQSPAYDSGGFEACGNDFQAAHPVATSQIGAATIRLFDAAAAAEFARTWLSAHHKF